MSEEIILLKCDRCGKGFGVLPRREGTFCLDALCIGRLHRKEPTYRVPIDRFPPQPLPHIGQ